MSDFEFETATADYRQACNMVICDAPSKDAVRMASDAIIAHDMDAVADHARKIANASEYWPSRPGAQARAREFRAIFMRFAA